MATYERQPVTKRKRTTHKWDGEQRLKYSKTDINYNDRLQTSSHDKTIEDRMATIASDEFSRTMAEILQSLRSETNRPGRSQPRSSRADLSMSGPLLRNPRTYRTSYRTGSRHAGFFEDLNDEMPKTTDTDWTIPQCKQDSQGQEYYWSGKLNGNRKIWTNNNPATWPPRECLEEGAREEMGGTFSFENEIFETASNAVGDLEIVLEDESSGEDTKQWAHTRDTGSAIRDGLKRKWMATGNFWED